MLCRVHASAQKGQAKTCGGRRCINRNRGESSPGWFIQSGIVGSFGPFSQAGSDFGLFVGVDEYGVLKAGTYITGTASIGSSGGGDVGLIFGFSDASVDNVAGVTFGANSGVDTPVVDFMVGMEAFNTESGGGLFNIQITLGFEPSLGGVFGADSTINNTIIDVYFQTAEP